MAPYKGAESYRAVSRKLFAILLFSTGFLAFAYTTGRPEWTETEYSRGIYVKIVEAWGGITSKFSFSAAEIVVYLIALAVAARIINGIIHMIAERTAAGRVFFLLDLVLACVAVACAISFFFIAMWGLNYNRLPFAETSGLAAAPSSSRALEKSCQVLVEQTNKLRGGVREDGDGVMALSVPKKNTLARAGEGFRAASNEFETLGDLTPGQAKPVLSSKLMSYAGITGIYFPLTAEANVNTDVTDTEIPFTVCHELAHQLGYAREDEANFIAWVACAYSPYEDYQYSGAAMALLHLLNALQGRDPAAWGRIRGMCSPSVNRDLNAMGQYWQLYEGPVSEMSETINDTFLRANGQADGVQSYGRMVDLVIAYLLANGMAIE